MSIADLSKKIILAASVFVIAEFAFSCSDDGESELGTSSFEYDYLSSSDSLYCGYCTQLNYNKECINYACQPITDSYKITECTQSVNQKEELPGVVFENKEKCEDTLIPKSSSSRSSSSSSAQ